MEGRTSACPPCPGPDTQVLSGRIQGNTGYTHTNKLPITVLQRVAKIDKLKLKYPKTKLKRKCSLNRGPHTSAL